MQDMISEFAKIALSRLSEHLSFEIILLVFLIMCFIYIWFLINHNKLLKYQIDSIDSRLANNLSEYGIDKSKLNQQSLPSDSNIRSENLIIVFQGNIVIQDAEKQYNMTKENIISSATDYSIKIADKSLIISSVNQNKTGD